MNKTFKIGLLITVFALSSVSVANAFSIGQRGGDVANLQATLIEAGYDIPAITSGGASFGYYGVQTDRANNLYQASRATKSPILGALSSPDIQSSYISFGGVRQWAYKTSMARAASTTCSIQAPVATSTLVGVSANMTTIASTTVFEIGYSNNSAYATTTLIATKTITGGAQDTILATSTTALYSLTPPQTLAPNSFINFKIGGGSIAGTNDPVGQCIAVFREVQ